LAKDAPRGQLQDVATPVAFSHADLYFQDKIMEDDVALLGGPARPASVTVSTAR
jgi:hypothetical protein